MNKRAVAYQLLVFVTQWALMILGFEILSGVVAPFRFLESSLPFGRYFDAGVKGLIALVLSVAWLFIWDLQVRLYFFRRRD